jgi:hypothetical protein
MLNVIFRYSSENVRSSPVPLCSLTNLQLRFLCPADLDEVLFLGGIFLKCIEGFIKINVSCNYLLQAN